MAVTTGFKEYERQARVMTVEDLFNLGMQYVDTPLAEGFAKLLVNYDLKNQGSSLTPRGGLKVVDSTFDDVLIDDDLTYSIHHVGSCMVKSIDGTDATVHKYVILAPVATHPADNRLAYKLTSMKVFLETDAGIISTTMSYDKYSDLRAKMSTIHGMTLEAMPQCNRGIFVSVEANTYIPISDASNTRKFVQLVMQFTSATTFTATLVDLIPKDVSASQVINSGYNMMKTDPYAFTISQNATGALVLNGVVPKDASGNIKLTADVGETLYYYLHYTYPASDAGKKYMVQWEVNDTATGAITQVLQQVRKSAQYTVGDAIAYAYAVAYKQFTLIVKVYAEADVTAHTYVSDEDDAKSLTPLKIITVSSYYTTAGLAGNAANLTPKKYSLASCADMCTWQQRVVLWGVTGAPTTLFVSQPNLPEYVPYPNNVEIFPEDIIRCVPYLTYLLVFTKSRLYQITLGALGYTSKCIQERLVMTEEDASTIQIVKNMVYFKSGNYFYMVVPNVSAGAGELQLAPVSRPIEALLDSFEKSVMEIIDDVYNINYLFGLKEGADDEYALKFVDYYNYLDGSTMRNVYKCRVSITKAGVLTDTRYIDFTLNYDTVQRAWTSYLYESTQYRLVTYESTVTSGVTFLTYIPVPTNTTGFRLQLAKFDPLLPKDELPIATATKERVFSNFQMIDTGYRDHFTAFKKRFREVQFTINNTQQDSLYFHTAFTVDDDVRKSLFQYTVQQITDPASPDYGLIYVERSYEEPEELGGAIKLGEGDGWVLDFAMFPELTVSKIRHSVSGKGYLGKLVILSKNDRLYELLGTNWVYRKMNGR